MPVNCPDGYPQESAVQAIAPPVIRAAENPAGIEATVHQAGAAMAADIKEGAGGASTIAHHDNGNAGIIVGQIIAARAQLPTLHH